MGYLTQKHISTSQVFEGKVEMALVKLIEATLSSTNVKHVAMAKQVMGNIHIYVRDLVLLLAGEGLDLDSPDTAIDTGILGNIQWLLFKTGNEG